MDKQSNGWILRCQCSDVREHAIHVHQWNTGDSSDDSEIGMCTINLSLEIRNAWYKRIWIGIKYMFGYTDHMQYMDTMVDVQSLKELVLKLEDNRTEKQKEAAKDNVDICKYEIL